MKLKTVAFLLVLQILSHPAYAIEFLFGEPTRLGRPINTARSEYGTAISADGLSLFLSRGSNSCLGCNSDLYVAKRASVDDPWGPPSELGPSINTDGTDGIPSITADGTALFFHDSLGRGAGNHRADGFGAGDLWVSRRETADSAWGQATNLGETINTRHIETGAGISADGLTLFFASDRPGGSGDLDIWYATRESRNAAWSDPQNLDVVNSPEFDSLPSLSSDGLSLFFSTARDRRGQYDTGLWVTTRDSVDTPWKEPVSLGPSINDPLGGAGSDWAPRLSADGSTLYYTTWIPGAEFEVFSAPVLPFDTVPLVPGADAYEQDFDEALGVDDDAEYPVGWTTSENGIVFEQETMHRFPAGFRFARTGSPTFNAGTADELDRTLAVGVRESQLPLLQLSAEVVESDASALLLSFDVEAWDATGSADSPGEAAFDVTVDIDSGKGFEPLIDLETVSTGTVLQTPVDEMINGNADANRISYDSGLQSTTIPNGSKLRIRWNVPEESASAGWIYGLDNVSLQLLKTTVMGDINGDGQTDVSDIDLLTTAILEGNQDARFDINSDGAVGAEDRRAWVHEAKNTYFGDANLDGLFDSSDLTTVFQGGQYEDGLPSNSTWATGDWDGDAEFSASDLVLAFQDGGYEAGPRAAIRSVPEPSAAVLVGLAIPTLLALQRRR